MKIKYEIYFMSRFFFHDLRFTELRFEQILLKLIFDREVHRNQGPLSDKVTLCSLSFSSCHSQRNISATNLSK